MTAPRSACRAFQGISTFRATKLATSAQLPYQTACSATPRPTATNVLMAIHSQPQTTPALPALQSLAAIIAPPLLSAYLASLAISSMVVYVRPARRDAWCATAAPTVSHALQLTSMGTF